MLGQRHRLRRCPNIKPTLFESLVFARMCVRSDLFYYSYIGALQTQDL